MIEDRGHAARALARVIDGENGVGRFAVLMGRIEVGIAAVRRAVVLDPLNRDSHRTLGLTLYLNRENREAIAAYQGALALDPEYLAARALNGVAYYALGDFEHPRASCETKTEYWETQCASP
jgi:tetratricopeptide (TPR) repeat protein